MSIPKNFGIIPAAQFFAAGSLAFTSGGPRPTPGGTDYDSSAQRNTRFRGAHPIIPTSMPWDAFVGARWPLMSPGTRACYPLLDINSQVFAAKNFSAPSAGDRQQNPMNLLAGQPAMIPKITG